MSRAWTLTLLFLSGCAVGAEAIPLGPGKDAGAVEVGAGDLGVGVDADEPSDSTVIDASTELDTMPAIDTATVLDSTMVDTTVIDTTVADTFKLDTAVSDTFKADTAIADTFVPDTYVPDTFKPDTAVTIDAGGDATSCPVRGCTTGTENRSGCANARTIGRVTAGSTAGYKISDDLCAASNKFDEGGSSCWDANADHAYRLWMFAGESVNLDVTTSWPCLSSQFSWYATLKIIENSGCDDMACTTRTFCAYNKFSHNKTFVAPRDGWYVFVVEGSSAFDDEGDYTFTVKLTCKTVGCDC